MSSNGKILSLNEAAKPPKDEIDGFVEQVTGAFQEISFQMKAHDAKLMDLHRRLKKIEDMLENRGPTGVPPETLN